MTTLDYYYVLKTANAHASAVDFAAEVMASAETDAAAAAQPLRVPPLVVVFFVLFCFVNILFQQRF